MRGQITFEYLLVSVVALALLSISVSALIAIKDYSGQSYAHYLFRYSANDLSNAIEEVCALGSGNSRAVELHSLVSVDYEDGLVRISNVTSVLHPVKCEVEPEDGLEGKISVKNKDGIIKIRER